ncbi:D-inositol-3-phosphate glycosyltransferase [compost metagenome]
MVYNGVSREYFPLLEIGVLEQVLFVGARSGYKNFESVVRALAGLKDLSLVCVGGGSFSNSERELLESNIPNRYRHAGFLSNAQLNYEYNRSLCLVYPSLYEGFGIPVLESMRAGCPVIAVNSSSIPEVAGSAAILMENGDVEEIKAAITYVMVNENRRDLVEKGFGQSRNFDWDKTFIKTISIYEEVLGKTLLVEK